MSETKQLHYSNRTFDIVPRAVRPRNFNLERGMFNQVSETEFKNPKNLTNIKNIMDTKEMNNYVNPYSICQTDFCDSSNLNTRKVDKRNRTDILGERLSANSKYINQQSNNVYTKRLTQINQNNPNSNNFKHTNISNNTTFKEYMEFKNKMSMEPKINN